MIFLYNLFKEHLLQAFFCGKRIWSSILFNEESQAYD